MSTQEVSSDVTLELITLTIDGFEITVPKEL